MDFSTKELVGTYSYVSKNREEVKSVIINGRSYLKFGTVTATTVVALQYKVYNPSVEHSEYITLMGVAHQNPGDITLNTELGYEIATENAMISPVATFKFDSKCSKDTIESIMRSYVKELPIRFIKTKAEILASGEDVTRYSRNTRNDNNEYSTYYNDFKKMFNK